MYGSGTPMTTPAPRTSALFGLLLLAYLAWGGLYIERTSHEIEGSRVFTLWDDAMISMRYARNLQAGDGLVWNPGEARVQGFTNPGVTLVMSVLHGLPLLPRTMSLPVQLLALACLAGSLVGVRRLAQQIFPETPAVAEGSAAAFALCAPVAIWGLQGSDVAFVTAWLVAAALLATQDTLRRSRFLGVLAVGLWIRPDSALAYPWLLLAAHQIHGRRTPVLLPGVAVGALSLGAYLAFGQLYYGDPLPNTYYLKATGSPRSLMLISGLEELLSWLPYLALPIALAVVGAWGRFREAPVWLLAALFGVTQAYNTWIGGDFIFGSGSRFAVPTLPFLLMLCAAGADRVLARLGDASSFQRVAAVALAGAALGWVSALPSASREWLDPSRPTLLYQQNRTNLVFGHYLRRYTDPSLSLAAHWGGVPPYFSERPSVDVLGKSDPHIARLVVDRFKPGHSKWDWDYVLHTRKPDVFRAPSRGLGKRDDFRALYLKAVTIRGLEFFLRRDAIAKLRDPNVTLFDLTTGKALPRRS
jgi:hypothetical protein